MSVRILVCKQQKSIPANLIEKEFILKILGSSQNLLGLYIPILY